MYELAVSSLWLAVVALWLVALPLALVNLSLATSGTSCPISPRTRLILTISAPFQVCDVILWKGSLSWIHDTRTT
ncbi:hypothetical protein B0H11DRAFT_2036380 [Mycena galericulata]|nr:hypothetical protein B0H11DRAFT_2036380 [Mycena galericulata]